MTSLRTLGGDSAWGQAVLWPAGARWRGAVWLLGVLVAYMGAALLYPFTETGGVSLFWMPNAALITALLKFRSRDWSYVYAAGLAAELILGLRSDFGPLNALHFGVVNAVEATLYVLCASMIAGGKRNVGLLSVRGTAAVVLTAGVVPAFTGLLGALGSVSAFGSDYFTGWRTWWFGDALGLLVGVPIGLLLKDAARPVAGRRTVLRVCVGAGAALLIVVSAGMALSGQVRGAQIVSLAAGVLLALTFGAVGAPVAAVLTATVTLMGLARHEGFAAAPQEQALLFVAVAAFYAIAATKESADYAEKRLRRQRRDLIEAKQRLKTEKERFEWVVGRSPSAISVSDVQHRYTLVNEAFCQLFDHDAVEEVIGRTEDEVLPPDVVRRSRQASVRLLAGESFFEEESIQRGSENILVVTQRFGLNDAAGAVTELVTIRTDITHRRRLEREAAERARWQEVVTTAICDRRLLVYSQPIVDITTRETVGEELLVRLRLVDEQEVLTPDAFLPQCERYGLMPLIDRYMVERAIDLAREGRNVSVNITGQTVADAATMEDILKMLTLAGRAVTTKIIFEITESTALASPAMAKELSSKMQDLGCPVALDDFGTGYGSFTELRHLDLYALKIDLSFVATLLDDPEDERVVKTIVSVAHAYGLTTIAEGVESEEVLGRLAELGADRAQGYLFGMPEPVIA